MTVIAAAGQEHALATRPRIVPLFRRGEPYCSRDVEEHILGGIPVQIGLAPGLVLADDARWLRRNLSELAPLPHGSRRRAMLSEALARFRSGTICVPGFGSQDATEFAGLLLSVCGLPQSLVERWFDLLETTFERESAKVPQVGGIEAVSLPANTFVCLSAVLTALLRSDAVWLRPSRHEPFSAARFLGALLAAGWPAPRISLYSTAHATLPAFVDAADRSVVFGGEGVRASLSGRAHVAVHGPGRSRALVGTSVPLKGAAEWLVGAVASNGGRFCLNVGTILHDGDTDTLGEALAARLDAIELGGPEDPMYPQPSPGSLIDVEATESWILTRLLPGDRRLTRRSIIAATTAGPILAPCLIRLGEAKNHPLLGAELPFAFGVLAAVPEHQQGALCSDAGFVFTVGLAPCPGMMSQAPHARWIAVAIDKSEGDI